MHSTVQIKVSLVIALTLTGWRRSSPLHVLVVGHAGLAVGPVLEDRLHDGDGAHGEEGGRLGLGDTGIGIITLLSVFMEAVLFDAEELVLLNAREPVLLDAEELVLLDAGERVLPNKFDNLID